ncbi:hypothetical protein [Streptomyces termitum]|uniref:hypothetical protein n=1 Tax=Streptomyces termitum TaxID=67368 RepID=UPI0037A360C9
MYLIHVRLCRPADGEPLAEMPGKILAEALPGEGVEHATVHVLSGREVVVGLFLRLDGLAVAEETALAVCSRVLDRHATGGFVVVSASAVPIWPFLDL